jgi:formate hydrogenlyase subunit 3/multisubunit Na+/H+ antiporter MnhD subunit
MAVVAILGCAATLLALSAGTVAGGRAVGGAAATRVVYGGTLIVSLAGFTIALAALLGADGQIAPEIVLPLGLPWVGARFAIDALSAFFLVVITLGAAAASLYGLGYGRHEAEPQRVLPFFPAYIAGMMLVVTAADAFSFLVAWEFMSLASWALVLAHHRDGENRRAAYVYILMASFGTFALLLAFGLLAGPTGGYAFETIRANVPNPLVAGTVLVLALVGAGSKAGLAPLHVWLPLAHPAAPSHVSALMSGVMTKVAVYGFIRLVFDLAGDAAWWWSMPVLVVGGLTAALGVLSALLQSDIKRVLAYSTIENIGLIFVGLGLALAFTANGLPGAGALALTAALFHVLNHALFKSALFFGAGAVLTATGERSLERLGGLIHRMPATTVAVLVACVAISALPPLNGFASEWLLFQAILLSPELPQWGLKLAVPAVGALLALSVALAAACFVRLYGIAFLGRPRSDAAASAHEVDRWSLAAMLGLAGLCVAAGVLPGLVIDALAPVATRLAGVPMPPQMGVAWLSIVPIAESRSSYNGLLVLVFIAVSSLAAAFAVHRFASQAVRRAPAWDCGFPNADPATQYTASSFAQPIRRVFAGTAFRARETVEMPPPGDLSPARFRLQLSDPVWDAVYLRIAGAVSVIADFANRLQFLTIRQYLSLVFFALVTLLLVLALWP